jgi:DNA-binding response OmpR family regulator
MSDAQRILMVESEVRMREVLAAALAGISRYEVSCADNDVAALGLLQAATKRPFDLIILDLSVQAGVAGLEVAREIRRKRSAGIILITCSSALAETARLSGCCDICFVMPFRLSAFLSAVQDLLALGRAYGQVAAATTHDEEENDHPGRVRLRPARRGVPVV